MLEFFSDLTSTDGVTNNKEFAMVRLCCVVFACVVGTSGIALAHGQERQQAKEEQSGVIVPTGNLHVDLFGLRDLESRPRLSDETLEGQEPSYKSPWIAAGLSLVLPGAGEFYADSYLKAAIFFVIEAAAWTVAYTQDRNGDKQTDAFQKFGDQNWSVVKYANYAEATYGPPNGPYTWHIAGTDNLPPWQQINWAELNRMERDIGGNSNNIEGRYFSHTLPPHGDQQYYEEIGKYPQFNTGWNDGSYNPGDFQYGDPLTSNFHYYSGERGKANTFYNRATTAVTIAVVNHVLSALDAGWTASSHNTVHAGVMMKTQQIGFTIHEVPVLTVGYSF